MKFYMFIRFSSLSWHFFSVLFFKTIYGLQVVLVLGMQVCFKSPDMVYKSSYSINIHIHGLKVISRDLLVVFKCVEICLTFTFTLSTCRLQDLQYFQLESLLIFFVTIMSVSTIYRFSKNVLVICFGRQVLIHFYNPSHIVFREMI